MINIKIYCTRKHKDYEATYNVFNDVLLESDLDFQITRISEVQTMALRNILYEPHVVINNQVVYARSCPSKEEVREILKRLRLMK